MPFFEQPPMPPRTGWRPPAWDRPSEAVLGAVVPLTLLLGRNDEYAFALEGVRAYPNGFTCDLVTLHSPLLPIDPAALHHPLAMHPLTGRGPRIGFEFSDGTRAQVERPSFGSPADALRWELGAGRRDHGGEHGLPADQHVRCPDRRRGPPAPAVPHPTRRRWRQRSLHDDVLVLPAAAVRTDDDPRGLAGSGADELSIPLDADVIREAARDAITLWEPDD
jgi:hypothetical protein